MKYRKTIDNYIMRFSLTKKKGYGKADILGPDEKLSLKSLKNIEMSLEEIFAEI